MLILVQTHVYLVFRQYVFLFPILTRIADSYGTHEQKRKVVHVLCILCIFLCITNKTHLTDASTLGQRLQMAEECECAEDSQSSHCLMDTQSSSDKYEYKNIIGKLKKSKR